MGKIVEMFIHVSCFEVFEKCKVLFRAKLMMIVVGRWREQPT
jgi:hypothetical protein